MSKSNEQKNTRLEVLKYKLKNYTPQQIAETLDIRLVTVHTYLREIKLQMSKETATELANMKPEDLALITEATTALMPFMEKSMAKVVESGVKLKALHGDVIDNAELVQLCLNRILTAEIDKDTPDLQVIGRVTGILNDTNKAFFNKEGIQIVQILNDNSTNVKVEEKKHRMDKLRDMMNSNGAVSGAETVVDESDIVDVELDLDEKEV